MLKFEGFQVGQLIRAQDFEPRAGRGECAVEGRIESVIRLGCAQFPAAHYVIRCTRDVWDGQDMQADHSRVGQQVFVPMESMLDWDGRVSIVSQEG